jgi:hypothetical protein
VKIRVAKIITDASPAEQGQHASRVAARPLSSATVSAEEAFVPVGWLHMRLKVSVSVSITMTRRFLWPSPRQIGTINNQLVHAGLIVRPRQGTRDP